VPVEEISNYRNLTLFFVLLLLTGCITGILVPAGLGWDFANFYDAGRRAAAGDFANLYIANAPIQGNPPQGNLTFYGTPLSAYLYIPFANFQPHTALILFKLQSTLCILFALLVLFFENRTFTLDSGIRHWKFAAEFSFLSLIYQPFWSIYRIGGQTTPLVLLFFTLSLFYNMRSRSFLSPFFLILAILIKPAFGVAFVFLLLVSDKSFFVNSLILLAVAGVVSLSLLGWDIHKQFLIQMFLGIKAIYPWLYNSSIYQPLEIFRDMGKPLLLNYALLTCRFGLGGSFFIWLIKSRRASLSPIAKRHFHFLMAILLSLMLPPNVWEHYLSLLFIILSYWIATKQNFSPSGKLLLYVIFFFSLFQNIILIEFLRNHWLFDSSGMLLIARAFKSAPLLLTFVFLWREYPNFLRTYKAAVWL
jgi:Glycosyltransferase family 87